MVLCPERRPITTLVCVLLKDSSLVFSVGLGFEISFRVCFWVQIRPRHIVTCWLSIHRFVFRYILPRDLQGRFRSNRLASLSAFSSPRTPVCPRTQVPKYAGWKHRSVVVVTVVAVVTSFLQPEGLSEPRGVCV